MDEGDITDLVNQLIQEAAQNNQYNPSMVPNHIGNGLDAPKPNFIGLGDTPHNYSGFAGYFTRVNSTETAIEFYSPTIPSITDIQIFNTSGTWTKPAGAKEVFIEGWGGGGGSGGTTANNQSAGAGAGGYSYRWMQASDIASPVTVTVGSGGTPGTVGPTVGGDGGNSTFGTYLTAFGGKGSDVGGSPKNGGNGGGFGTISFVGANGTTGTAATPDYGGGAGGGIAGGIASAGGNSIFGAGGGGGGSTGSTQGAGGTSLYDGGAGGAGGGNHVGIDGSQPGGGGGGSGSVGGGGNKAGATGGAGRIRVTTFF